MFETLKPMDYIPPGSYTWDSAAKSAGVDGYFLLGSSHLVMEYKSFLELQADFLLSVPPGSSTQGLFNNI